MTVIFEDVFRALLIQANITGSRVYLMRAPETPTVPYQIFFPTGPEPLHVHEGPLDVLIRNYQVSIFHTSQSQALAMADTLRGYLDGYTNENYQGVEFGSVFFRLQSWAYEEETRLFHIILEFRIYYRLLAGFLTFNPAVKTAVPTKGK